MQTRTEGYDPKANGRAEAYAGILKHKATEALLKQKLQISLWCWAMRQESYLYMCQVLGLELPQSPYIWGKGLDEATSTSAEVVWSKD